MTQQLSRRSSKEVINMSTTGRQNASRVDNDEDKKDDNGNTLLHRLVLQISLEVENDELLKDFDSELEKSVIRWCEEKKSEQEPSETDILSKKKYEAVYDLTRGKFNNNKESVLSLAMRHGLTDVVRRLLPLKVSTATKDKSQSTKTVKYNITRLTPLTNDGQEGPSCIEAIPRTLVAFQVLNVKCLKRCEVITRQAESHPKILGEPPLRQIMKMYSALASVTYCIIFVLHMGYMALFTHYSLQVLAKMNQTVNDSFTGNSTNNDANYTNQTTSMNNENFENEMKTRIQFYCSGAIEPVFLVIYTIIAISSTVKRKYISRGMKYRIIFSNIAPHSFDFVTVASTGFVFMQYHMNGDYFRALLAFTLLWGWGRSISYAKGIKCLHVFSLIIWRVAMQDVAKIIFVYVFVILGFSCVLYSVNIVEQNTTFGTVVFMVFNVMSTMGDVFFKNDYEADLELGAVTRMTKMLYIILLIIITVILINLLIAMINSTYGKLKENKDDLWTLECIQIAVDIEWIVPRWAKFFYTYYGVTKEGERWVMEVKDSAVSPQDMERRPNET